MEEKNIQVSLEVSIGTPREEIEKLLAPHQFSVLESSQSSCCGCTPTEIYVLKGPEAKYEELQSAALQTKYTLSLENAEDDLEEGCKGNCC